MNEHAEKAKWVLDNKGITGVPANSLGEIAKTENICYKLCRLEDMPDLDGLLTYRGSKVGLVVNTIKDNIGRQNFTFAHELGHFFLKHEPSYNSDGENGFRCTMNESATDQCEVEANKFAVELLMPESMFRPLLAGATLDFVLIGSMARRFMVSKHACCNRILDFISGNYAVIHSKGTTITSCKTSKAAVSQIKRLKTIPAETHAFQAIENKRNQSEFAECDLIKWLPAAPLNGKIFEYTHGSFQNGVAMTILTW